MNRRHTLQIAGYAARTSVRGGIGLVFLLLSLTFGLLVAHFMMQPIESMARLMVDPALYETEEGRRDAELRVLEQLTEQAKPVIVWMLPSTPGNAAEEDDEAARETRRKRPRLAVSTDKDTEKWATYLLEDRPGILSAIFLILLLGWPFVVAFGAFDLYAGDIASRQLRYQLLRADRSSIYFGRLLGLCITLVAVLSLLGLVVTVYLGLKLGVYPWGEMLLWALQGTLMMVVVSLPYTALCGWISTAAGGSFTSLTLASLAIGGVPLAASLGSLQFESAQYVNWLLPWGFQSRLLHHDLLQQALAIGGCLLQTTVFVWLGHRTFTRRDL
ncbi:MAG: hypothetical protein JNL12_07810 [Planctomycetes bacterium]|nr:hypothetical protein [Planctomycetota bacterium]